MSTSFTDVYDSFLGKITDDMYLELTPEDTIRDLRSLLINAIPEFEFPRCDITDYNIKTLVVREDTVTEDDFIIGIVWNTPEESTPDNPNKIPDVYVEKSTFSNDLTGEEINILAILMMCGWLQRQITSIENTRMKYSGSDFKMTSQANHLAKLLTLLTECQRQSHHMQRLYKRRRNYGEGKIESNWDIFRTGVIRRGHKI